VQCSPLVIFEKGADGMNRNDFGFNWKIVIMYFYGAAD
jgi:hypothetical protein